MAEELSVLKQVDDNISKGFSPPKGKNGAFIRYFLYQTQVSTLNELEMELQSMHAHPMDN